MPNKSMSKAAKKRHLETSGIKCCPYCKADNWCDIEYSEPDPVECGDIQQEARCLKCGRRWMDVFRLVAVRELCNLRGDECT